MRDYLEPDEFADSDNPEIVRATKEITAGYKSHKEAAARIFRFVQDIDYIWKFPPSMASETLKIRRGMCWDKSILQVAMLRCAGIPARYRLQSFYKGIYKGILPEPLYSSLSNVLIFPHALAETFLEDRWVASDASIPLKAKQVFGDRAGRWKGEDIYFLRKEEIAKELGAFVSLQPVVEEIKNSLREKNITEELLENIFKIANEAFTSAP